MAKDIIFREKDEKAFWQYWEQLATQLRVGPRYTRSIAQLNPEYLDSLVKDKSFVYFINGKPVACVFLPIEKHGKELFCTMQGTYVNAPLFQDATARKAVFSSIDEIAEKENIGKAMFSMDPLAQDLEYNYLQKYGYLDTSILNYVIDLTKENLLQDCRHGHQYEIKKILNDKDFNIFFVDKSNPSYELHEEYRILHHKSAGRVTRSKKTFDMQFERLKQGNAVLFGLRYQGKNIAYSYFEHDFDKALYASSADDPEYAYLSLYHAIIYSAMEYLKAKGVQHIDTSQPSSPSPQFDYYPDKKQLNIALFKRGFGGDFRMNFRGIKYFSKALFKQDMKLFGEKYAESIATEK